MTKEEKAAIWRRRVEEQQDSGLSTKVYCAREGLAVASLHYWRKRLGGRQREGAVQAPDFMPVTLAPTSPVAPVAPIEIRLRSGRSLQLSGRVDLSWLRSLVQILDGPCG